MSFTRWDIDVKEPISVVQPISVSQPISVIKADDNSPNKVRDLLLDPSISEIVDATGGINANSQVEYFMNFNSYLDLVGSEYWAIYIGSSSLATTKLFVKVTLRIQQVENQDTSNDQVLKIGIRLFNPNTSSIEYFGDHFYVVLPSNFRTYIPFTIIVGFFIWGDREVRIYSNSDPNARFRGVAHGTVFKII